MPTLSRIVRSVVDFWSTRGTEQVAPSPLRSSSSDFIDVKTLLRTLSVEELARTAEEYFQQHETASSFYYAKPFNSPEDAPDLLAEFCQVLLGIRAPVGSKILEFGAGTCWATRFLTQLGYAVTATDVSATALKIGRALFEQMPVAGQHVPPEFLLFDGRRVQVADNTFDRVMCLDALHHVPNVPEVLKELARVLRPGGVAGFSEPGPTHSRTPESQYEMRHYTIIENDIVMEDIERWAIEAGFTRVALALFEPRSFLVNRRDYEEFTSGGRVVGRYVDFVRQTVTSRRVFFLYKGEDDVRDSRERRGLAADIRVTLDSTTGAAEATFSGEAQLRNTGTRLWLPSDAPSGAVRLGVRLHDADGTLVVLDYARIPLPDGASVPPGQNVHFRFVVPAPPRGRHRLSFDLVSEQVCWFETNGTKPAVIDVTVR